MPMITSRTLIPASLLLLGAFFLFPGRAAATIPNLYVGSNSSSQTTNFTSGTHAYSNTFVGVNAGDSNNLLTIGNAATRLSNSTTIYLGYQGGDNTLIISNAAVLADNYAYIGRSNSSSNDAAFVTDPGSLWTNGGDLAVGFDGSGNSLVISNGGTVAVHGNSSGLVIGYNADSSNNTVLLSGTDPGGNNSALNVGGSASHAVSRADLYVGYNGSSNSLTLSNGGQAYVSGSNYGVVIGFGSNSSGNSISLAGSASNNGYASSSLNTLGDLYVGYNGSSNNVVLSNGGYAYAGGSNGLVIGFGSNSSGNTVAVSGWNSTNSQESSVQIGTYYGFATNSDLYVGYNGSSNTLSISNGADVWVSGCNYGAVIGFGSTASGNSMLVSGYDTNVGYSSLDVGSSSNGIFNGADLYVGYNGSSNSLTLSNGGQAYVSGSNYGMVIGFSANSFNNLFTVTGSNSLLLDSGSLYVGYGGQSNRMVISAGGFVSDTSGFDDGADPNDGFNSVLVTGAGSVWTNSASLTFGLAGHDNSLVVSNGGVVGVAGAAMIGDQSTATNNSILITGAGSSLVVGGTLTVGNSGGGTLTVAGGGSVSAGAISIAANGGSHGTVNLGTLGGSDTAVSLVASSITFGPGLGTLKFNQADSNTISATISGSGDIYQLGTGQTILSGNNNAFGGTARLYHGTLQANSSSALGSSSVYLNGGALSVNALLNVYNFYWYNTNSVVAINNPGANYLHVTGNFSLGDDTNGYSFSLYNYTPGAATELLTFGNGSFTPTTNGFSVNNVQGYSLFTSNNALWILGGSSGLIASNTTTTVGGTQTNPAVTFQPSGILNVTPNGNLTITGGITTTNNGTVTLNGTLNTPFVFVASGGTIGGSGNLNGNLTNSGTVSPGNSPGTLTVTGNFVQTSGGTLLIQVANGAHDMLNVSGSASLDGTLIITPYGGHVFQYGEIIPFLSAATVTGSFSSIEAPQGYRGRVKVVGDPVLEVILAPASYTQVAANGNQSNVATALNSFIPATGGDQLVVSTALDSLSGAQYQQAFNAIMPTIYQSLATIAFNSANAQNSELVQRLWGLRVAGTGFSISGFADNTAILEGQGDGGVMDAKKDILRPGADSHWGMFVDGNGIFAQSTSANMLPTYNFESGGITTGFTYKWNENFGTGIYAGYEGTYAKYNNGGGVGGGSSLIDNSARFGIFGTYGQKNAKNEAVGFYADAMAGGGYNNYAMTRNIAFGSSTNSTTFNRTATSSPGAGELDTMLAGGYDVKRGNWTFGPTASLQYTYLGVNSVNEAGAQSLDFSSGGWNSSSLLSSLGAHAAYNWQVNKNVLVVPQINLSWQHEFMQNPYAINGSLGGSPNFSNWSAAPIRDTLYTGIGFTVEFAKRWNTSFFYNAAAGNANLTSENIFWSAGVRF